METLVFGTINPAKIAQIRGVLRPVGIDVVGLPDEARGLSIVENGQTAQENARKKAMAYARALGQPVLSVDNALFLDGLEPDEQPGIHVRRIGDGSRRITDEEALAHYLAIIIRLGGRVNGRWEYAFCYARPNGSCEETTITTPRVFVATPCDQTIPGYPLESIQIDPASGRFIAELLPAEKDEFWRQTIGAELVPFIQAIND